MNKVVILKKMYFLRAVFCSFLLFFIARVLHADSKPNIILFLADDMDKDMIHCFGGPTFTPHLDKMAQEGMRFTNAHVSSTVCAPSRYSFITGRYPGRSRYQIYLDKYPLGTQGHPTNNIIGLEKDNMNVGNVLRQNGYVTGFIGKWHLNNKQDYKEHGLKYIPEDANPENPEIRKAKKYNEKRFREFIEEKGFSWAKHVYWKNMENPYAKHNPEWTIEAALEFIRENKDRPFYLHYCTTLMHGGTNSWRESIKQPHISGEGYLEKLPDVMASRDSIIKMAEEWFKGRNDSLNKVGHPGKSRREFAYTWLDESVGAFIRELDRLGISENTLFIFISDHGSWMKSSLFEQGGTNVPCIMRWPGHIRKGAVCDKLILNVDLVPTFFDLAEAEIPKDYKIDGISLKPLFDGKQDEWRDHIYFEVGNARAVRTSEWKYISVRHPKSSVKRIKSASLKELPKHLGYIENFGLSSRGMNNNPNYLSLDQLYNIKKDPREINNLANDSVYSDRLQEMKEILKEYLTSFEGRPFGEFIPGGDAVPFSNLSDIMEEAQRKMERIKIEQRRVIIKDRE